MRHVNAQLMISWGLLSLFLERFGKTTAGIERRSASDLAIGYLLCHRDFGKSVGAEYAASKRSAHDPSPAQLSVTEYVVPVWARYGSFWAGCGSRFGTLCVRFSTSYSLKTLAIPNS
jgi:hypothetical protein